MKKEIETMLKVDDARYDINGVFSLSWYRLHSESDVIGREEGHLHLEFNPAGGGRYYKRAELAGRTAAEISAEIEPIMEWMLAEYSEDMIRLIRGGNWGRLKVIE